MIAGKLTIKRNISERCYTHLIKSFEQFLVYFKSELCQSQYKQDAESPISLFGFSDSLTPTNAKGTPVVRVCGVTALTGRNVNSLLK